MVQRLAVTFLASAIAGGIAVAAQTPSKPSATNPFVIAGASERLEIDGSKNPELIPEWYVWEAFFRLLHKAGTTPSALNLTPSEERVLQMELEQYANAYQECQTKIGRLRPLIGVAPINQVNERQRAIQLEYRRRSLDIRDRLLAGVRPDAAVAIVQWVENLKNGIEISVPKRELTHFRQPR